jgi:hypothetical protein
MNRMNKIFYSILPYYKRGGKKREEQSKDPLSAKRLVKKTEIERKLMT